MQEGTQPAEEKTPWKEFVEELESKGRSSIRFFSQRKAILKNPSIITNSNAIVLPGWKSPLSFALQGLLLVTLAVSCLGFIAKEAFDLHESNVLEGIVSSDLPQQLKSYEHSLEQLHAQAPRSSIQLLYPEGASTTVL